MSEECSELECSRPYLYAYAAVSSIPLLISYDGSTTGEIALTTNLDEPLLI